MKDLRYFDPHRRATWLELFFDLIFVVALRDAGEILGELTRPESGRSVAEEPRLRPG